MLLIYGDQSRFGDHIVLIPLTLQVAVEVVTVFVGITKAERPDGVVPQLSSLQIGQSPLALTLFQLDIEISGRRLVDLQKDGLRIRPLPGFLRQLLPGQLHASPIRQILQRLQEGIVLIFHEKCEHIPPCPAAETIIHLLLPAHGEGRGLLIVEGAQSEIGTSFLLQLHIAGDHVYDIIF